MSDTDLQNGSALSRRTLASMTATAPLLVGEANPYGADPRFALYPSPTRSAGSRLCHLILGMSQREYLTSFRRTNLCPIGWSATVARERAAHLVSTESAIILLGSKVSRAFGLAYEPLKTLTPYSAGIRNTRILILPHPSGLNRYWNQPGAVAAARAAVADFRKSVSQ